MATSTTPPELACFIQAHPSRNAIHAPLVASLSPLPVEISLHASSPPNPWAGYKQALERFVSHENSHGIVLQDDAVVCRDFPLAVTAAIEERPDSVLSLWVGALRGRTTRDFHLAQQRGERWSPLYFRDIHFTVALVWPRELAEAFLEWASEAKIPGWARSQQSDDAVVGAWARRTKRQFWACVPCLVEHNDEVESTIGRPRGDRGRRAISFIDSPFP